MIRKYRSYVTVQLQRMSSLAIEGHIRKLYATSSHDVLEMQVTVILNIAHSTPEVAC